MVRRGFFIWDIINLIFYTSREKGEILTEGEVARSYVMDVYGEF